MKPIPAGKVLTEFGAKPPSSPLRQEHSRPEQVKAPAAANKMPALIEEAYNRGLAEGRAAMLAELEHKLAEQQSFHEKQLELERCTRTSREIERLAEKFTAGLLSIETAITEHTAQLLKPFLIDQIRQQAIAELCTALETLLAKNESLTLHVSGPEELLQLLRDKLSDRSIATVFSPADTIDVRMTVGQTILETCLGAWMAKFEEFLKNACSRGRRGAP